MKEHDEGFFWPRLHDVVELVDRLLSMVLQVCVPPLSLIGATAARMPDDVRVAGTGSSEVARQADLHMPRQNLTQAESITHAFILQQRIHDQLEGANHPANGCTHQSHELVWIKALLCIPTERCFILQLKQDAGRRHCEKAVIPHGGMQLPDLHLVK